MSYLKDKNIYHIAAKYSLIDILKEATEYELNTKDENGRTPIHLASLKGNLNALKLILSLGGKVNKCDLFGNSALHYAVRSRNLKCVLLLIIYEPKLIWMMDLNELNSRDLAENLGYKEITNLIEDFIKKMNLKPDKIGQIKSKELKNAQRRRDKYICLMKYAAKKQLNEYKKFSSKSHKTNDNKIIIDESITLLPGLYSSSSSSSSSLLSKSSFFDSIAKIKSKRKLFLNIFNKSAYQISYA